MSFVRNSVRLMPFARNSGKIIQAGVSSESAAAPAFLDSTVKERLWTLTLKRSLASQSADPAAHVAHDNMHLIFSPNLCSWTVVFSRSVLRSLVPFPSVGFGVSCFVLLVAVCCLHLGARPLVVVSVSVLVSATVALISRLPSTNTANVRRAQA